MSSRPITGFFLIFVDEQIEMLYMTQISAENFSNRKKSTPYIIHPSLFTWTEISTTLVEDVYS